MMLLLFEYLMTLQVKVPAVFFYASTRMMLGLLTALLCTFWLGPRCIKKLYEMKTGQSIRVEDCPLLKTLHEKKRETPTMGGILILFSMVVSLVLWMDFTNSFTWLLLGTTIWLGFIGGYDDYLKLKYKNSKGMRAWLKFSLQALLAVIVTLYLYGFKGVEYSTYYLPFYKDPIFILTGGLLIFGFLISILTIAGASNGVNLTDGLDGLAAGCLIIAAAVFAVFAFLSNNIELASYLNIAYLEGSSEIGIYLFALVGACLGFLWFNCYPAQIFMGDTGSLALGGILGVSAVLLRKEFLLAIVGGIFVMEALSVILQVGSYKYRNKKRIFLCAPLHHHFEYKGWPETKVVVRFWIVALLLAIVGLTSLKFQ